MSIELNYRVFDLSLKTNVQESASELLILHFLSFSLKFFTQRIKILSLKAKEIQLKIRRMVFFSSQN